MTEFSSSRLSVYPLLVPLILHVLPLLQQSHPRTHTPTSVISLTPSQAKSLSTTISNRLDILHNITHTPPYTSRPYLTPASRDAQALIFSWMTHANLSAYIDPAGNVIADLSCPTNIKRRKLMLGSHHDTVPKAGKFDGVYGVLAAISVAQVLKNKVCRLPFDIRLVAFDDEEGNNQFGTTNFGARAYIGAINWEEHVSDMDKFTSAYKSLYGNVDVKREVEKASGEVPLAYLELHLEQGPVLQKRGKSVGMVDAIAGQTRLTISLEGESGHAGTVPIRHRRDALAAAAEGISFVEKVPSGVVATVGRLDIKPNVGNVIPGLVDLSIDIRSPDDGKRKRAIRRIVKEFHSAGKKRGVLVKVEVHHDVSAVKMSDWVMDELSGVVDGGVLTSGAGHDAQILAEVTDVGMLFVRCNGVSHRPDEYVSPEDVFNGARALLASVLRLGERVKHMDDGAVA